MQDRFYSKARIKNNHNVKDCIYTEDNPQKIEKTKGCILMKNKMSKQTVPQITMFLYKILSGLIMHLHRVIYEFGFLFSAYDYLNK